MMRLELVRHLSLCVAGLALSSSAMHSQVREPELSAAPVEIAALLPDAPEPVTSPVPSKAAIGFPLPDWQAASVATSVPARRLALTIRPNQTAVPWTARDKFEASLLKEASIGGVSSMVFSGAYGTWRDLRPHYGTDAEAFGQRVGAAAVRQTSQSFFNVGLFSALLHDDPRYYVEGPTYSFKHRVLYAATRVVITRKDDGRNTFNLPLIAGVMSSSALTNAYYPDIDDHSVRRTIVSGLFSLTYRLGTQQLKEFSGEIRQRLHLKH